MTKKEECTEYEQYMKKYNAEREGMTEFEIWIKDNENEGKVKIEQGPYERPFKDEISFIDSDDLKDYIKDKKLVEKDFMEDFKYLIELIGESGLSYRVRYNEIKTKYEKEVL